MDDKGDLWYQLAHILDPRDPDDPPRPYAPILIEATDQLEKFFCDFADRWRRGADKEVTEIQGFWGLKMAELRKENQDLKHSIEVMVDSMKDEGCPYKEEAALLRKEIIDITARSIQGRIEAWDLIDKMIPYVKFRMEIYDFATADERALLAEIEEKRKPHG